MQIKSGLERAGVEVVLSVPSRLIAQVSGDFSKELGALSWSDENQDQLISQVRPDAVIYSSGWKHVALKSKPESSLIIDLHGEEIEVCKQSDLLLNVLSKADALLLSDQKLRNYFFGWLVQAGRIPESTDIIRHVAADPTASLEELTSFLLSPRRLKESRPYYGAVHPKADYVSSVGERTEIELKAGERLVQRFVVPEEHTGSVELELSPVEPLPASDSAYVEAELSMPGGKTISRKHCKIKDLSPEGRFLVHFPASLRSLGGEEVSLSLSIGGSDRGQACLRVSAVEAARFPLTSAAKKSSSDSSENSRAALALSFSPGDQSGLFRARVLLQRAIWLMKRGEWRRVVWAVRRRVPIVGAAFRRKLARFGTG
ncbi:MAG: hypothetical protein KDD66_10615 [Bdellovibrionales bacterium]|nr:hypothetical protein [Bdellovibrionales bacterium]